jgi:hypothetical protein
VVIAFHISEGALPPPGMENRMENPVFEKPVDTIFSQT